MFGLLNTVQKAPALQALSFANNFFLDDPIPIIRRMDERRQIATWTKNQTVKPEKGFESKAGIIAQWSGVVIQL